MVILITGASHTGKTVLAQRMLSAYQYPHFSIDHLKMGLIRSKLTNLTPEDDDALTAYLWPIVREIIKTAIENRQNLIVEGCYVPFDWRKSFDASDLASIRFICLAMTDRFLDDHFDDVRTHACDVEFRGNDADCLIDRLKTDNRQVIAGFQAAGETVTLIQTDYEETIRSLIFQAHNSHHSV